MLANLLKTDQHYYHPLTLEDTKPFVFSLDSEGNFSQIGSKPQEPKRKSLLTIEDIVHYYYNEVGIQNMVNFSFDCGGVKYLLSVVTLDLALFSIDALITNYLEDDHRPAHPPRIINAKNFLHQGQDRRAEAIAIAKEYNIAPITTKGLSLKELGI